MDACLPTPPLPGQYQPVEKPFTLAINTPSTPLDALPANELKIIHNSSGLSASTSYIFTKGMDVFRVYTNTVSVGLSLIRTTSI